MVLAKSPEETYLKIVLPKALKEQFKMVCWGEGKTMTNRLVQLILEEVIRSQELLEEARLLQEVIGKKSK